MNAVQWGRRAGVIVCVLAAWGAGVAAADTVTLKNGMRLEGSVANLAGIGADPNAPPTGGAVPQKPVVLVDDQLRRIFVPRNQVTNIAPTPPTSSVRIQIPQRVATSGRVIGSVGPIVRVTPFDDFGRRIFTMRGHDGNIDLVQGITEITPRYTKVEALQGTNAYVLTMRIATSSIPRDQLSRIIYRVIDTKNAEDRLKVVRLYVESERFQDARAELEQVVKDFPDLAHLQATVKALHQQSAQRLIREIELRMNAGQYVLAIAMLEQFPQEGVAGETLLKVRDMLGELAAMKGQGDKVQELLKEHLAEIKEDKTREEVRPIIEEMAAELNVHTLDRLADYLRLADDKSLSAEQKLSLAISGWLLGSGAGGENLAVSQSLVKVRDLVRQYLRTTRKPERQLILDELASMEGATPANIARLVAHMKPPLETDVAALAVDPGDPAAVLGLPRENDKPAAAGPEAAAPEAAAPEAAAPPRVAPAAPAAPAAPVRGAPPGAKRREPPRNPTYEDILEGPPVIPVRPIAARRAAVPGDEEEPIADAAPPLAPADEAQPAIAGATGIPGNFEMTVAGLPEDPQIKYYVQLPPEYSPYRRYPCIVTLNGAGTTPQQQIDWWAGGYNEQAQSRFGQATRHGYIVIAPQWIREHQREYESSAREHAAVLFALRDATKRLSIDTDRVFLSGHSMGGDAAWDIGLAHPDLWAGVIPIVARSRKYVVRYWENARDVPLYFVGGDRDGTWLEDNVTDWDRYLRYINFDTTIVLYQGRGHEHFHDEVQAIFEWANLHKRNFFPRDFTVVSLRPWDSFFWWVETPKLKPGNIILPEAWGDKATPAKTEAKVLATNGVLVKSMAEKVTVWLSPEIVDFGRPMTITITPGRRQVNVQPSIATLLEDVRTRGDRQHPFWAKVEN